MIERNEIKVLIVEDNLLICEMIEGLLNKPPYRVIGKAADGEQATEMVPRLKPDVILMDIQMPGMDGITALQEICKHHPTPAVMLTAYDSPELVNQASAAGAGAYLVKPPEAGALDRAITVTLARFNDLMAVRRLNSELQTRITERQQVEKEREALLQQVQGYAHQLKAAHESLETHYARLQSQAETLRSQNEQLRQTQQQLDSERRRYQDLFEMAPDGYLVTDTVGVIREANRAALAMLAVEADSVVGRPLSQFVVDEAREILAGQLIRLQKDRQSLRWETLLHSRNRPPFPAIFYAAPTGKPTGLVTEFRWMLHDITQRKRIEEEREQLLHQVQQERLKTEALARNLQEERDLLYTIMENVPAHLAYLDPHFNFVRVNYPFARGAGYARADLINRNHFELFPDFESRELFEKVRDTGKAIVRHSRPFMYPARSERGMTYWDWNLIPIKDAEGRVQGLVFSMLDVTERKQAEAQREHNLIVSRRLVKVSEELLKESAQEQLLDRVIQAARELLEVPRSAAWYNSGGTPLIRHSSTEDGPGLLPPEAADNSELRIPYGEQLTRKSAFRLRNLEADFNGTPTRPSLLGARLVDQTGQINGVLLVAGQPDHEFTPEHESLLIQLAALASLGLRNLEARQDAERRADELDATIAAIAEGVLIFDHRGEVLRTNAAVRDLLPAYAPYGTVPIVETARPLVARALQGETVRNIILPLQNDADDQPIWISASVAPVESGAGRRRSAVCTFTDVTPLHIAQRHLEQAKSALERQAEDLRIQNQKLEWLTRELLAQRARLNAIIEATPEGIIVVDRESHVVLSNPAAAQLLGKPGSWDPCGKTPTGLRFFTPDGRRHTLERLPLLAAALQGITNQEAELTIQWPLQELQTLLAGSAPIYNEQGEIEGAVLIFRDLTEHKRLLLQLQEQHKRAEALARETQQANQLLQTLIDTMPTGVLACNPAGQITLSNIAARTIIGSPIPESVYGRKDYELCTPDGQPLSLSERPFIRVIEGSELHNRQELLLRRADRSEVVLWISCAAVRDAGNRLLGAIEVLQDITELKQTRETLQQYANRLQVLHELDRTILATLSAREIAAAALPYVQALVPCSRIEIVRFDTEAGEVELLAARDENTASLSAGRRYPLDEFPGLSILQQGRVFIAGDAPHPTPETPPATLLSLPLIAQGQLIGALSLGKPDPEWPLEQREIAGGVADELAIGLQQAELREQVHHHATELELRVAERTAELRTSETRFRTIFESSALGIMLVDTAGRIQESNPALQRILGYSGTELREYDFFTLFPPRHIIEARTLYQALLDGNTDEQLLSTGCLHREGQLLWTNWTFSLVRDLLGTPQFAIVMVEDVTEQRRAQLALIQAERLATAGKLAASLTHEINNPLQSVIGCLGLAEEALAEQRDITRYLKVAGEELQRAARIVGQLRDLNRQSSPEERELTDLNALLDRALLLSRRQCEDHQLEVQWQPDPAIPQLSLVPDRIHQVFLNLILNAIDAMPDGGCLKIRTLWTPDPTGVQITFIDNGIGINREAISNIFNPFYTTKPEGLGLGLFISQNIIAEHNGRLEVSSRVGEGTEFTIWLPA